MSRLRLAATTLLATWFLCALSGCQKSEAEALEEVRRAAQTEQGPATRIALKSFLQTHPGSAEGRYLLGINFQLAGEASAAAVELQRALEAGFPRAQVAPPLAEAWVELRQGSKALEKFGNEELGSPEAQARLQAALALALAHQGKLDAAMVTIEAALKKDAASDRALLVKAMLQAERKDITGALSTVETLLKAHPKSPEAWTAKGDLLSRKNDGQAEADAAYRKALEFKPQHVPALSARLGLLVAAGEAKAARERFGALEKAAPGAPHTLYMDARIAYLEGRHDRTRELTQLLLRGMPESLRVLMLAGANEMKLGSLVQADALLTKTLSLDPNHLTARQLLAEIQLRMGQSAKALSTLAPLIAMPEAPGFALGMAAEAHLVAGNTVAADALFKRLAKAKPEDPALRTLVARSGLGGAGAADVEAELRSIAQADRGDSADLALISTFMGKQAFDRALEAVDALEKKLPGQARTQLLRGQALVGKGDLPAARAALDAAVALDPGYTPAVQALAGLDIQENKVEAAAQRFKALLAVRPNDERALLALAVIERRLGKTPGEVLQHLTRAVAAAPNEPRTHAALVMHHYDTSDFGAALTAAKAGVEAVPDNPDLYELLARCQWRSGERGQALRSWSKVVSLTPGSPRGHVGMADLYVEAGDNEAARRSVARALEIDPKNIEARALSVVVASRAGRHAEALKVVQKLQLDTPNNAAAWVLEGDIEAGRKNWDAAATAYRAALGKRSPGLAHLRLYNVLARGGKTEEARQFASDWMKQQPQDLRFLMMLGDTALLAGRHQEARSRYKEVLAIAPDHVLALNNLASSLMAVGDPAALASAERASQLAPNEPRVMDTLAQALAQAGRTSEALALQARATMLAPDDLDLKLTHARLLLKAGESSRAREELLRLARMDGNSRKQEALDLLKSMRSSP